MSEEHWTDVEMDRREALAHEVHGVYCMQYMLNEGKPYWTNGDYSRLEEKIKDFDRALVAWHLTKMQQHGVGVPGSIASYIAERDHWKDKAEKAEEKLLRIENLLHALPHWDNCNSIYKSNVQPSSCDCWKKELT